MENLGKLLSPDQGGELYDSLQEIVEASGNQLIAEWHKEGTIALKNPGGYIQAIDDGLQYPYESNPLHLVISHLSSF